jgi:hypothetical protein
MAANETDLASDDRRGRENDVPTWFLNLHQLEVIAGTDLRGSKNDVPNA